MIDAAFVTQSVTLGVFSEPNLCDLIMFSEVKWWSAQDQHRTSSNSTSKLRNSLIPKTWFTPHLPLKHTERCYPVVTLAGFLVFRELKIILSQLLKSARGVGVARLNIEDQFFLEIGTIARKFANDDEAIGNAIRFFRYAQEKHKQGLFVPEADFAMLGFSEALFPLFAKRTDQGIQCAGADKHFGWLLDEAERGRIGGQRSAEARRLKYGSSQPKQTRSKPEARRSNSKQPEAAEPSSSSSSSSSSSCSSSPSFLRSSDEEKAAPPIANAPVPIGRDLIAHYCDAYKTRYPDNPVIRPQDAKLIKTLGESLGAARIKELLTAYLRMNNAWFVTKAHDLATFHASLNQIQNFSATGQIVTAQDARSLESGEALKNQIDRLSRGAS